PGAFHRFKWLDITEQPGPVGAQLLLPLGNRQPRRPGLCLRRALSAHGRGKLMQGLARQLLLHFRGEAQQLVRLAALLKLRLRGGHAEPLFQGRVDPLAMLGTDIVAVSAFRRFAGDLAPAVDGREVIRGFTPTEDLLEPGPDRIVLAVPGELMGIDQPPGCGTADDDPRKEAVSGGEPEVASRFPAAAA